MGSLVGVRYDVLESPSKYLLYVAGNAVAWGGVFGSFALGGPVGVIVWLLLLWAGNSMGVLPENPGDMFLDGGMG